MDFIDFDKKYIHHIHRWNNNPLLSGKLGFDEPQSLEATKDLMDNWLIDDNRETFIIIHHDKPIGYVTLVNINKKYGSCELHTVVGEIEFIGQKVCVEVINKILSYAFDVLALNRVSTYSLGNNPKLIKTALKYGWTQEGILRQAVRLNNEYIDYYIFGMLKQEFNQRRQIQCQ